MRLLIPTFVALFALVAQEVVAQTAGITTIVCYTTGVIITVTQT
jgi:hypothetical protein